MKEKNQHKTENVISDQELRQLMKQEAHTLNLEYALQSAPYYTLEEILAAKSLKLLQKMSDIFRIPKAKRTEKDEWMAALQKKILNAEQIENFLLYLPEAEWELFQETVSTQHLCRNSLAVDSYPMLQMTGLIELFFYEEQFCLVVPNEIKQIYHDLLNTEFLNNKNFYQLLNCYAQAVTNLYGVIRQEDFVELFNGHNPRQTNAEEVFSILEQFVPFESGYCLWGEYLVSDTLEENEFESAEYYIQRNMLIPRYMPHSEELLQYADWTYYPETQPMRKFKKYLSGQFKLDQDQVESMMEDLGFMARQDIPLQAFFDLLAEYEIEAEYEQMQIIVGHITEIQNNSRHWANNGHTPKELSLAKQKDSDPAKPEPIKAAKPGRNDPCPCGSGKKYKKCCGQAE